MLQRFIDLIKFQIERFLVRGPLHRLLVIVGFIAFVSLAGGLAVHAFAPGFDRFGEAVWWAFLRLSDPGYLGDDQGALRRAVSLLITVAGYVLFLGAMIAIMTQWLNQTLRTLERGLTPVAQNNHIVILGWTNRTPAIVRDLMSSEGRVRRFLQLRGARRLRIAILAEDVSAELTHELRDYLGEYWSSRRIVFRSGDPLRSDHLRRVDHANAAAVLLPGRDLGSDSPREADTQTIKTLLSLATPRPGDHGAAPPLVVAELFDNRALPRSRAFYVGPLEVIASDRMIAAMMVQGIRHPGFSEVLGELLVSDGNEIYVRECPETLHGARCEQLEGAFPRAIVIGLVRPGPDGSFESFLDPAADVKVEPDDRVALIAEEYLDTEPQPELRRERPAPTRMTPPALSLASPCRVLLLGWNRRAMTLLAELDRHDDVRCEIDIASSLPAEQREGQLASLDVKLQAAQVRQIELDTTMAAHLGRLDLNRYDNIVILASDRFETGTQSDARTIACYLLLLDQLAQNSAAPHLLVELADPANVRLLEGHPGEVLVSPLVLSHLLAQVTLRREVHAVYRELLGPGGAEIFTRPLSDYGLESGTRSFDELRRAARHHGEVALGVRYARQTPRTRLNPPPDEPLGLGPGDTIIAIAHSPARSRHD